MEDDRKVYLTNSRHIFLMGLGLHKIRCSFVSAG